MADAAFCQRFQMVDRYRVGLGQTDKLAALLFIGGGIVTGQVANMGLIDGDIGGVLLAVWRLEAVPSFRFQGRIVEIHYLTELGVHRQTQGVGIGHLIVLNLAA